MVGDYLHALFSLFFSQFLEDSAEERVHTRLRISLQVVFFQSHDNYNNGEYRLQYVGSIANVSSTNMDQALHVQFCVFSEKGYRVFLKFGLKKGSEMESGF